MRVCETLKRVAIGALLLAAFSMASEAKTKVTSQPFGKLPDGTSINMKTLFAKDVINLYPKFNNWGSRGCSDYWNLSNDTLSFS